MRRRRNPEVVAGRVAADGSIVAGTGFAVQRTAAGSYSITTPGLRPISATASPAAAPNGAYMTAIAGDVFTIVVTNTSGVAVDVSFSFVAVGTAT